MEMRLGKTKTIIHWIKSTNPTRVLIVCPLTVVSTTWTNNELPAEGISESIFIDSKLKKSFKQPYIVTGKQIGRAHV